LKLSKQQKLSRAKARPVTLNYNCERALSDRLNAVTNPADITMLTARVKPPFSTDFHILSMLQLYGVAAMGACPDETIA